MKEFIIKLLMGMIVNSIDVQTVVTFINKMKEDLKKKVEESEPVWDDIALNAFLNSEDDILTFFEMMRAMADEKVKESEGTTDNVIWLGLSAKLKEIIAELKK